MVSRRSAKITPFCNTSGPSLGEEIDDTETSQSRREGKCPVARLFAPLKNSSTPFILVISRVVFPLLSRFRDLLGMAFFPMLQQKISWPMWTISQIDFLKTLI